MIELPQIVAPELLRDPRRMKRRTFLQTCAMAGLATTIKHSSRFIPQHFMPPVGVLEQVVTPSFPYPYTPLRDLRATRGKMLDVLRGKQPITENHIFEAILDVVGSIDKNDLPETETVYLTAYDKEDIMCEYFNPIGKDGKPYEIASIERPEDLTTAVEFHRYQNGIVQSFLCNSETDENVPLVLSQYNLRGILRLITTAAHNPIPLGVNELDEGELEARDLQYARKIIPRVIAQTMLQASHTPSDMHAQLAEQPES